VKPPTCWGCGKTPAAYRWITHTRMAYALCPLCTAAWRQLAPGIDGLGPRQLSTLTAAVTR
jgi:hypothetical protein